MANNPILDELYDTRARILAEHEDRIGKFLRAEFEKSVSQGHPIARIPQRSIRRAETGESGDDRIESAATNRTI